MLKYNRLYTGITKGGASFVGYSRDGVSVTDDFDEKQIREEDILDRFLVIETPQRDATPKPHLRVVMVHVYDHIKHYGVGVCYVNKWHHARIDGKVGYPAVRPPDYFLMIDFKRELDA